MSAPQAPQNNVAVGIIVAHEGHGRSSATPHAPQKLKPGGFEAPQAWHPTPSLGDIA